MFGSPLAAGLLLMSAGLVEIIPLDGTRFTVTTLFSGSSVSANESAQIALMQAAAKHCSGRGVAVSDGGLQLDNADPDAKGRKRLRLSETYSCVARTGR